MNTSQKSAFTLIELLVVIAVIAILAGIAMPVFSKVLEKAHVTQDVNNLRQIGVATVAYLNDNGNIIFSKKTSVASSSGNTLYAPGLLESNYALAAQVFHSPFDRRPNANSPAIVSYGVNSNILDRPVPATASTFNGSFNTLVAASSLILYAPAYKGNPTTASSWTYFDNTQDAELPSGGTGMSQGTHQSGQWIDVLYCDFHVSSIKFSVFQSTATAATGNSVNGALQWYPLGTAAGE